MKSLVIGNGLRGTAEGSLLLAKGVSIVYFDYTDSVPAYEIYEKLGTSEDVEVFVGELPVSVLTDVGDVVIGEGISPQETIVKQLRGRGHRIMSELELAASYDRGKILAVTGTKGKTSATALLYKIIKDRTRNAFLVGNEAGSYSDAVCFTTKDSTTVAKVGTSFLQSIESFHPKVSAIINIKRGFPESIGSFDEYVRLKERICANQTCEDTVVLNYEDDYTRRFGMKLSDIYDGPEPFFFSTQRVLREGLFIRDDKIILGVGESEREVMKTSDLRIVGRHNLENAFCAIAMAYRYGISVDSIARSCAGFVPLAHRVEFVATKNGVNFYNDSKGCDVKTAINGIEAMDRPTYLIGGGYDSGADFGEWIDSFNGKVKKLVLIGQTKERMASAAHSRGFNDYVYADNLEEAVSICTSFANPGEAVLLSPACEVGTYRNFEERGNAFRSIVERL